ncbi:hypothetical protein [Hespellia stercorisuis]|uniref:Uncharacterized protein n=1 Tax=Hespellia stercorisuis DSM 15480 TaxID=1121950 RepID=A0A1M6K587_9FIRM|nr:hypothetical protein [Hespellia stercorisuis]SHJ54124.1 hypothetical protein SAMN02745243_00813 [Hespellia stercorisuis DSM 15480]
MDKYEYKLKTEQMLELAGDGEFEKAAEIAESIDWRRVKNASMLLSVSDIYEAIGNYKKCYGILKIAYERASGGRKVVYRLGDLSIRLKNIDRAIEYYDEFIEIAPKDPNQYILRYKILRAQNAPVEEQIESLEEFKKAEYIEEWAYELAKLYQEAGMTAECLEECDDLILWFSEGRYVYQAMELKMQYKPLTPSQLEKYNHRYDNKEATTGPVVARPAARSGFAPVPKKTEAEEPELEEPGNQRANIGDIQELVAPELMEMDLMESQQEEPEVREPKTMEVDSIESALAGLGVIEPIVKDDFEEEPKEPEEPAVPKEEIEGDELDDGLWEEPEEEEEPETVKKKSPIFGATMALSEAIENLVHGVTKFRAEFHEHEEERGEEKDESDDDYMDDRYEDDGYEDDGYVVGDHTDDEYEDDDYEVDGEVKDNASERKRSKKTSSKAAEEEKSQTKAAEAENIPNGKAPKRKASKNASRKLKIDEEPVEVKKADRRTILDAPTMRLPDVEDALEKLKAEKAKKDTSQFRIPATDDIVEEVVEKTPEEEIAGQLSLEDILSDWDAQAEKEEVKTETEKPAVDSVLPEDIQRMIDEIESLGQTVPEEETAMDEEAGIAIAQETAVVSDEDETGYEDATDEYGEAGEPEDGSVEYDDADGVEEDSDEYDDADDFEDDSDEYEDDFDDADEYDDAEDFEDDADEYDEADEYDDDADEYDEDEYEDDSDEYDEDEYEDDSDEYDEDEYEDDSDEYDEDEYEDDSDEYDEDEYEDDSDEYDEDEYEDDSDEYDDDEYEDDSDEYDDDFDDADEYDDAEDFEDEADDDFEDQDDFDDLEEEDFDDFDEEDDLGIMDDLEAKIEKQTAKSRPVLDDREIDDDDLPDLLSSTTPLSRKETAKLIATGKTAPLPLDEISNALSMSDTGFIVHGRYDLESQSGIGTRAGLTDEQKKLFSYFVPVRGMSEQLVDVLEHDKHCTNRNGTSSTGNLLIIGRKGSGKTVLAVDVVKAIQKQRNIKQGKVAIVTGDSLNKKKVPEILAKLYGGALIIEKAGKMNEKTVARLNKAMEKDTGELLIVLEEQRKPLDRLLTSNREFRRKFTSRLEVPIFINDELVTFGQTYARENGYRIDEMGILALYSRIDALQREDHAVTVAEVKEIMDEAQEHSKKSSAKKLVKRVFGRSTDSSDRIILSEKDFNI